MHTAQTHTALIVLIMLILCVPAMAQPEEAADPEEEAYDREEKTLGDMFGLVFRAGYSSTGWEPLQFEPFEVEGYAHHLLFAELALDHPLLFAELALDHPLLSLGEALDLISIPRLRVESNLGYTTSSGTVKAIVPKTARDNHYLRALGWLRFEDRISFRYRTERFQVNVSIPDEVFPGVPPKDLSTMQVTNELSLLELGVDLSDFWSENGQHLIEAGVFSHSALFPNDIVTSRNGQPVAAVDERRLTRRGVYVMVGSELREKMNRVRGDFIVRAGEIFGVEGRLLYDLAISESWLIGMQLEASLLSRQPTEGSVDDENPDSKPDASNFRYWLSICAAWSIF